MSTDHDTDAALDSENPTHRRIRSFVLRRGHLSRAQERALETLLPVFGVPYQTTPPDWDSVFGRTAPMIVEIGFGMGQATADIAQTLPDYNFLGLEVHSPGVGSLLKLVEEKQLSNIRVAQHDAVEVLRDMIAPNSLAGVHIFFPDPWHKKRHHKRRLIQAPFVADLVSRIAPGGYLHVATDWEDYAIQILDVLSQTAGLENTAEGYAEKPAYRPQTKFEARGLRLGHGVWDIVFRKSA